MAFHNRLSKFVAGCALSLLAGPASSQTAIDLGSPQQAITGFGGMNFPRWIADLTEDQAQTAFGTGAGQIGLSMLRISAAPVQNDWAKELPTAKLAKALGAAVFATPWSPPASMKNNNDLVDGQLKTESYAAYAKHLSDFVTYMKTNGVELYAISIQNEPDITVSYESCRWNATQIQNFLKNNAADIPTKVIAAESFHMDKTITDASLNDAGAAANFEIVAEHLYGVSPSSYPLAKTRGKELWMTEHYTTSDRSANLWPDAIEVGKEIHNCLVNNFNAYVWWYIRRSYGLMTEDGVVSKRGWVMAHFSRFVRPGFVRVDMPSSPATGLMATAYRKGGDVVVVVINTNTTSKTQAFTLSNGVSPVPSFKKYTTSSSKNLAEDAATVDVSNNAFTVSFDAQSVTTLVYKDLSSIGDRRGVAPASTRFVPGAYDVFELSGVRIGGVAAADESLLRSEVRKIAPKAGLYVVKSKVGEHRTRIGVQVR